MKIRILLASATALAIFSPVANALTIDNTDKSAYTVKVTPTGGKEMDIAVKASAKADVDCKMGCTLSLGGKTEAIDAKKTMITIKDGKFVM